MRARIDPGPELQRLARLQSGVVSREQSVGTGFGRHGIERMLSSGRWSIVTPGVYLTVPRADGRIEWMSLVWAGVLIGGDSARIAGLGAARLYGLISDEPDPVLVQIDHTVRRVDRDHWTFRRERPGHQFRGPRGNPPRIAIEDLVLDLIDGDDPRQKGAAHWLSVAVQRQLTTPRHLARALAGRRAIAERELINDILSDVEDGSESPLELRYVRQVERPHGLPRGRRQSVRRAGRFESTIRSYRDVYYDDYGLVVELDGKAGHIEEGRLRDLRRDNVSTLRGDRTLRYGWIDVSTEPCLTAFQVAGGLQLGGWAGMPQRCTKCKNVPESLLWDPR